MPRYEDPSVDPAVEEAIINIRQVIRYLALLWEWAVKREDPMADDLASAQADLEQAVRFLRGEEEPS